MVKQRFRRTKRWRRKQRVRELVIKITNDLRANLQRFLGEPNSQQTRKLIGEATAEQIVYGIDFGSGDSQTVTYSYKIDEGGKIEILGNYKIKT